ncbi:MAG: ABC transporter permease [Verrucomicrobiota bacterium]
MSSFRRIYVLAASTFTQLVRMKVFYFPALFALLIFVLSMVLLRFPRPEEQLKQLVDVSLGSLFLFGSIFGIVATSLLLPKDIEDRTLYTILSKPVRRIEYLLGKLLGVLGLVGVTMLLMNLVFSGVLYFRQEALVAEELRFLSPTGEVSEAVRAQEIRSYGLTWNLQKGVFITFLKSSVAAAIALLVSTIASSTLFTILVSTTIFFIGHVQKIARDFWLAGQGDAFLPKAGAALVSLLFPDFQLYNAIDGVAAGDLISNGAVGYLLGVTSLYLAVYTCIAWFAFVDKEL